MKYLENTNSPLLAKIALKDAFVHPLILVDFVLHRHDFGDVVIAHIVRVVVENWLRRNLKKRNFTNV